MSEKEYVMIQGATGRDKISVHAEYPQIMITFTGLSMSETIMRGCLKNQSMKIVSMLINEINEKQFGYIHNCESLINMLLIGLSALVGFFFISLLLARWAIRPVARSWKQQRQFVADASHELKTPLTVVLSNVDMLREYGEEQNERERRWMDNVRASSLQMKISPLKMDYLNLL